MARGCVSQLARSRRALNPPTRMSKLEFFDSPGYGASSIRRTASSWSRQENQEGTANMHFENKKVIVVGGSAGIGRQVAIDIVGHGGSAVIVGRSKARVDDTVAELTSRPGEGWGIAAELTDRAAIADVQRALSEHHSDATLLVNAAGFFIPKPFLEYDQQFYDSYMELNYALFFLTQAVVAGMIAKR